MMSTSKLSSRKSFSGSVDNFNGGNVEQYNNNSALEPISEFESMGMKAGGANKRSSFASFFQTPRTDQKNKGDNELEHIAEEQTTSRLSFFGGGASNQQSTDINPFNNQWSRLQEQEILNLRQELVDLRKKYDIIRSIHVKNTKNERMRAKAEKEKQVNDPSSSRKKMNPSGLGGFIDDSSTVHDVEGGNSVKLSHESQNSTKFKAAVHTTMLVNSVKGMVGENESEKSDSNSRDSSSSTGNNESSGANKGVPKHDENPEADDDEILHAGYLRRKNFFNKHTTLFYFILRKKERKLYYYTAPKNVPDLLHESVLCRYHKDNFSGKWNTKKCRAAIDKNDKTKILLSLTGKKVTLIADDEESANEWARALDHKLSGITGVGITGTLQKLDFKERASGVITEDDIATIMKQTSSEKVKSFLDKVLETETFFGRFDDVLQTAFKDGVANPQQMFHTYEIIAAMQSLYSHVLHFGEQWTADTKEWLLGMLRQTITLPIEEPEMLMAVIQCLTRENMLFAPETVNTVNQVRQIIACCSLA